jgi:hypothetical protein
MPADSHNILNRQRNHFSQLSNKTVNRISEIRQIEIHTVEPLVPDPTRIRLASHVARMGRRGMRMGFWWESQKERNH